MDIEKSAEILCGFCSAPDPYHERSCPYKGGCAPLPPRSLAASAKSEEQSERKPSDVPVKGECACGHPAFTHRDSGIERYCMIHGCGCECFWPTAPAVPAQGQQQSEAEQDYYKRRKAHICPECAAFHVEPRWPYKPVPAQWDGELIEFVDGVSVAALTDEEKHRVKRFIDEAAKMENAPIAWMIAAGFRTEAKLAAARERISELERDAKRLDWLESRRLALNKHYGTEYGWRFISSPNVHRLLVRDVNTIDLNDCEPRGTDIRKAVDDAMSDAALRTCGAKGEAL